MKIKPAGLALLFALAWTGGVQANEGDAEKRRLVEQKLRLVDMLIQSPAAKAREGESAALIERGRQALIEARQALSENKLDAAATLLDEALRAASSASKHRNAGATLSDSAQRKSLVDLSEQLASYRTSLVELGEDAKLGAEAKVLLARIDTARAESERQANAGQLGEANRTLAGAYRLAVEEIARFRAGQEVVMKLDFATPADEFAYEQQRFASNEILIDQMLAEGKANDGRQQLVERFVAEARAKKEAADGRAAAGSHEEAVALMEKAVGSLYRALQAMGVPIY